MRDYANLYEPLTLANMESCNTVLIGKKLIRKSEWSCLENWQEPNYFLWRIWILKEWKNWRFWIMKS